MSMSVQYIALVAKQLQIEELKRLKYRSQLVSAAGHMIHVLQTERGSSSIYLASSGQRFDDERRRHIADSLEIEQDLRQQIERELDNPAASNTRIISLMAWVVLGLDALPELRLRIEKHKLSGEEAVGAFSRLIAGFISLIFEVADAAVDPRVSRMLVALFNFIQGKELAGQERAVGALSFGSGIASEHLLQRLAHLVDAQDRSIKVFLEFTESPAIKLWNSLQDESYIEELHKMREFLVNAQSGSSLDTDLSDSWFDCCTSRLSSMWVIQCQLVDALQASCSTLIESAEAQLLDSKGLIESLKKSPPAQAELVDRFFDPDLPVEQALSFIPPVQDASHQVHSVIDLLQSQSGHLANMEKELSSARRALSERKVIEQAKGILMARFNLSADEAYKKMRTTSMEQNRRLIDVAESVLAFVAIQ